MKKFMSFLVAVSMIIAFIPGISAASPESDFEFDPATGTITDYTGPGGNVEIPDTIGGVAVTSIGDSAFCGCISLTGIIYPK